MGAIAVLVNLLTLLTVNRYGFVNRAIALQNKTPAVEYASSSLGFCRPKWLPFRLALHRSLQSCEGNQTPATILILAPPRICAIAFADSNIGGASAGFAPGEYLIAADHFR